MSNLRVKNSKKGFSVEDKRKSDFAIQAGINQGIEADFLQVISDIGENLGKMSKKDALDFAIARELDLVVVLDKGQLDCPVAKVMNYSKKLYEDKKKNNAAKKKKSDSSQVKELRISPKISDHDLQIKMNQGVRFLKDGCRVKVVLIMKGRERSLRDTLGAEVFLKTEGMLSKAAEESTKNLVIDSDSEGYGAVCKIFYLKK